MSFPSVKQLVLLLSICVLLSVNVLAKDKWRPISAEERQMTKGKVDPEADAEAIFWEVRINDAGTSNLVIEHYIRLKILTDRGREQFSKVDIPYTKRIKIRNIEARVVKPDNTITELSDADVFDREIVKTDDVKVKAKSFAVPNIEAGVIVEYRYKEVRRGAWANNMRLVFQREIPMHEVTYYVKPYTTMKWFPFNLKGEKFIKDKKGFYKIEMADVPALKEEPNMPPEDEVRSWMLLYYDSKSNSDFWARLSGILVDVYEIRDTLKPGKKMRAATEDVIAGATSDEEKIRKLYDFCKTKIRNLDFDTSLKEDELEDIKINKDDDDTYKKRQGRAFEINRLFASMAAAAGFEARIAFTGDRSKIFFNPRQAHSSFVHMAGASVLVDNKWEYFDPGSPFLPYKSLAWFEQNTSVFLLGRDDYITTRTELSGYKDAQINRKADLTLLEDGTLEGDVTIEYTGHYSHRYKMNYYESSANAREEALKARINARMSTAELSNIVIENVSDLEKPFTYKFRISVPNYAQKVGRRMFLQPGFFTFGTQARFSASERVHDVYFDFPWSENDDVAIKLPEGYKLDNADAPAEVKDRSDIGSLNTEIFINNSTNTLQYKRRFYFGNGGMNFFAAKSYGTIKALFDLFHKNNTHTLTLQKEVTAE